ncbi:MAG: hypothetical protein ABIQ73_26485 [Acidimicrobiales bacterium]
MSEDPYVSLRRAFAAQADEFKQFAEAFSALDARQAEIAKAFKPAPGKDLGKDFAAMEERIADRGKILDDRFEPLAKLARAEAAKWDALAAELGEKWPLRLDP